MVTADHLFGTEYAVTVPALALTSRILGVGSRKSSQRQHDGRASKKPCNTTTITLVLFAWLETGWQILVPLRCFVYVYTFHNPDDFSAFVGDILEAGLEHLILRIPKTLSGTLELIPSPLPS